MRRDQAEPRVAAGFWAVFLREHSQWWAIIPGGILAVLGVLIAADAGPVLELLEYLWPVALIAVGLALLWRASRRHSPRPR